MAIVDIERVLGGSVYWKEQCAGARQHARSAEAVLSMKSPQAFSSQFAKIPFFNFDCFWVKSEHIWLAPYFDSDWWLVAAASARQP